MKTIQLTCDYCHKEFTKSLKEYKRKQKIKMVNNFCCLGHSTSFANYARSSDEWKERYEKQSSTFDIKSRCQNRLDDCSPFRKILNVALHRPKNEKCDLDLPYLKELWETQKGICGYTKLEMILPKTSNEYNSTRSLRKASLDRIDSSKGYIKGNVEFVCLSINYAKLDFNKHEFETFLKDVLSVNQTQPT